ncbi:hypothetical protein BJY01DRAFT_262813 [Aspergillus pseudoustus]|uniref:CorA-like transporter domain-containing protein n=1 Tax=Aspergillus pseudoustus TaxID=1810923 RepID=A0ABR4IB15_9EURO
MDQYLIERVNTRSSKIFKEKHGRAQLELSIIDRIHDGSGDYVLARQPKTQINQIEELKKSSTQTSNECSRIYTIQHTRSWTTLDISRPLFDQLLDTHKIFNGLWRTILAFGMRLCENEYGFPLPLTRESRSGKIIHQELAYVIQRVERNGRLNSESPWSIRQTGVYQKLTQSERNLEDAKALFLLVAPSSATENSVLDELSRKASEWADSTGSALCVHGCVVAESLKGWVDYMCWLEEQLKLKSARIMTSSIYGGSDTRPIGFVEKDRQGLKQLEEYINDLLVILRNKVHSIGRIKRSCLQYCSVHRSDKQPCICLRAMEELEEYAAEAQNYQDRVKVLQTEVQSVQSCLSDLLRYQESADIKQLTIRNALDATAVKLLTIITILFLPLTLVENFFSTQFVTTVGGGLQVSVYALIMVAVSLPLTGLVFLGWRFWLRHEYSRFHPGSFQREDSKAEEIV